MIAPLSHPRAGVVFDMDGLMLDTEVIARESWRRAARLHGAEMSDELFASMIGRTREDGIKLLRVAYGPAFDIETAYAQCAGFYHEHISQHGLPLKTGVRELLEDLSARNIPLAVATSTRNPHARERLQQVGLLRYFAAVVAGDEVANGKPAPDIYLEAVRRLDIDPAVSFALEDSYSGVRAAHGAGLNTIMVPDLLPATAEITALTFRVLPSLHDVRTLFAG